MLIPIIDDNFVIQINGAAVASISPSDGRPGGDGLGLAVLRFDGKSLGWIGSGAGSDPRFRPSVRAVVSALAMRGDFRPDWKHVEDSPDGVVFRRQCPRHDLEVVATPPLRGSRASFLPRIVWRWRSPLWQTSHALAPALTIDAAMALLDRLDAKITFRQSAPLGELSPWIGAWNKPKPGCAVDLKPVILGFVRPMLALVVEQTIRPDGGKSYGARYYSALFSLSDALDKLAPANRLGFDVWPEIALWFVGALKQALQSAYRGDWRPLTSLEGVCSPPSKADQEYFRRDWRERPWSDADFIAWAKAALINPLERHRAKTWAKSRNAAGRIASRRHFQEPRSDRADAADLPMHRLDRYHFASGDVSETPIDDVVGKPAAMPNPTRLDVVLNTRTGLSASINAVGRLGPPKVTITRL